MTASLSFIQYRTANDLDTFEATRLEHMLRSLQTVLTHLQDACLAKFEDLLAYAWVLQM